jgi:CheY-like chemotaxis protein/anti-sigma regulatory factor (Ser/Thr protein kinase)
MSRILIVEDSPTQAQQLSYVLQNAGFVVESAGNGQQALEKIARELPDAVVTDLEMPEMNGLVLVERIRGQYPSVPVILMTAYGSEDIAALALKKGAASYVPKRYLMQDIIGTLGDVLSVATSARQREGVRDLLKQTSYQFILENDAEQIPPLIGYLEEALTEMSLCDQTGLIRVCVALREALVNAMYHGNLEIDSSERESDINEYHRLIDERAKQDPYRDRRVHVTASLSRQKAEFRVRDEGPGFDPAELPDPADPANLEKVSGRGLLLIRTFMDQVRHNESGNEITLVKRADYSE